jgi:hypothetical protein
LVEVEIELSIDDLLDGVPDFGLQPKIKIMTTNRHLKIAMLNFMLAK